LVNKQRSKQVRHTEGGLLDGDVVTTNDLDYAMQGVSFTQNLRVFQVLI
jgi:translation initiation factor 3 subunit L